VRVEDFMTRRVVAITPDTTLLAAAKLMLEHRVGGLPVLDPSARIIGIFSESDLLREEGKGEDGSPWLQNGRTGRGACRAAPARRAKSQ
jgi:CBS-domain-containing membrane protein